MSIRTNQQGGDGTGSKDRLSQKNGVVIMFENSTIRQLPLMKKICTTGGQSVLKKAF
jgi:hypothetical protein